MARNPFKIKDSTAAGILLVSVGATLCMTVFAVVIYASECHRWHSPALNALENSAVFIRFGV